MKDLLRASQAFEDVYNTAMFLQSHLEQLEPGKPVTEHSWYVCVQMARRLTSEVDTLRADLTKISRNVQQESLGGD